ncbi:hypothetical protein LMG28688_05987 [Paraburkholderia caffeinitolerans]|uniref:DUF2844 domain-containing protein n=1 Tax=Paraburkholderia caffeinitolerans TaxID=1723730 RepID=A0A6J5GS69_9BURK|nr:MULTISPECIES: DUF2844 domain-containing protein [Paraburkholderia]CAB3804485.1 hypothetical protein LMG28688_05987 [Paraburkholderia caffeinitolerans]
MKTCSCLQAGRAATFACLFSGLAAGAAPAHAALGDTAPAETPQASTPANAQTLAGGAARVTSYVDAGGTHFNEYIATRNGQIFAYTWQGPTPPDLDALLGRYAADWHSGATALHAAGRDSLHAARVDTPTVVVESGGQMRSYIGRAWLPAALPAGITEGDLQ